jgi:hypothetical protein
VNVDGYLVQFNMYAIAGSEPEALTRVKVWRALAAGTGFEPGIGRVTPVPDADLPASVLRLLQAARERVRRPASAAVRHDAINALSTFFDGDITFAGELVESIEQRSGHLPGALAAALVDAGPVREPA